MRGGTRWLLWLALLGLPARVAGQVPQRVPPPQPDSLAADSLAAQADSIHPTDRLLEAEQQRLVQRMPLPRVGGQGILPAGSRKVFVRDSIEWSAARTVGDLIAGTGAYIWRGGWVGRPEMPNVQGRGSASVEYTVDGLPWLTVGPDSLATDPSLWSLTLLERVEIEDGPGLMRVHLYTRAHDRQAPRTKIGVSTGDRAFEQYFGSFERRWESGIGLSLGAEYTGVNDIDGFSGSGNVTNGWIQLGWLRDPRFGIQAQTLIQDIERDPFLPGPGTGAGVDTLDPGITGTRNSTQLRGFWRGRDDDTGPRVDAFLARTTFDNDTVSQDIGTMGVVTSYRQPDWSAELTALHHTDWTTLDSRLALGWTPTDRLTVAIEGVYQSHYGQRESRWGTARVGLAFAEGERLPLGVRLPFALRLGAVARDGRRVQTPSLESAPEQNFTDLEATAAIDWGRLGLEGRFRRLDAWTPAPYRAFRNVVSLGPVPETEWVSVKGRIAPLSWMTFESAYDHPVGGALPEGVPPQHSWTTATIRSKFLRNFPSGVFDLKVQGVVENWSNGIIGRDANGVAINLPATTLYRSIIQLQIGPFILWYDRVNWQGSRIGTVPGFPIQNLGTTYGVRWEFAN